MERAPTRAFSPYSADVDVLELARRERLLLQQLTAKKLDGLSHGRTPRPRPTSPRRPVSRGPFLPMYPEVRDPPLTSHTAVPPWTTGGSMRMLGANNLGQVTRRKTHSPRRYESPEARRRRREEVDAAVASWRQEQRRQGEQWVEETRWYARGEPSGPHATKHM